MPYARIQHEGGAVNTTLVADITSGATSLTLTASTNWPDGSVGPFYLVIDPGLSNEEKILATARSTNTLTGLTRGTDGTVASAHTAGAVIKHIFSAAEADEANALVKMTLGTVTAKGDLPVATASGVLGKLAIGANDTVAVADSAQTTGLKWATLGANSLAANAVGTAQIQALAVTLAKMAADSVDSSKIVDASIATGDIAALAITSGLLAANSVILSKFGTGLRPGFIVADATALAALTPSAGDLAFQVDIKCLLVYTGTAWVGVQDITAGRGNGRRWRVHNLATPAGTEDLNGGDTTFPTLNTFNVAVPAWATKAVMRTTINQAYAVTATMNHSLQNAIGTIDGTGRRIRWEPSVAGTVGAVDSSSRQDITIVDQLTVTTVAGTTVAARTHGSRVSGTGGLRVTTESFCSIDIEFSEL